MRIHAPASRAPATLCAPLLSGALLLGAASLPACVVGFAPIGGDDETGDGDGDPGDGDGDPGDGDGAPGDGDGSPGDGDGSPGDGDGDGAPGDGDGDPGDCPPAPQSPFEVEFDFTIATAGDPIAVNPLDAACTITAITPGTDAALALACGGTDVSLTITATPGLELVGSPGEPVHLWLYHDGDEFAPTWLRVDFPEHDASLFVIEAEPFAPPNSYFPAPWDLQVADSCGPLDDGCATVRPEQLELTMLGQSVAAWPNDYAGVELSEARIELWNARAEQIVDIGPLCDPTPDFFLSHRVLIHSIGGGPVEGEVCSPGESDPCGTGLHCCYPCGVPDCNFVCTPEDPNTMECPPPPP